MSILAELAARQKIDVRIENSSMGLYLKSIAGESGCWQYRVNDRLPMRGAHDVALAGGDEVVWFYDPNGCMRPLRIRPKRTEASTNEFILFRVDQFNDESDCWLPAENAVVMADHRVFPVTAGVARVRFPKGGCHTVWAEKKDIVRSAPRTITITKPAWWYE